MLPIKKAVDDLFKKCGQVGNYKGKSVFFLMYEPDVTIGVGFAQAHTDTYTLKIRKSDAPTLSVGDKIATAERIYRIYSEPKKDIHNLILTAEVTLCD